MPEFVNPNQILNQLGLKSTMVAADFGCGSGGWTLPLARLLNHGKVFAVDIKEEAFSALRSKAKLMGGSNIKEIIGNLEGKIPELRESIFDLVLITDLLLQLDNKKAVFKEAFRILKSGGKVLVVDWSPQSPFGPGDEKVSPEKVKNISEEVGFRFEKELNAGAYHFALIFSKP